MFFGDGKGGVFGFYDMILGFGGVWRKIKMRLVLFGFYLLSGGFLHENVEKRGNFGLAFYVLLKYSKRKWKR